MYDTIDLTTALMIDLDGVAEIIVKINGKEFKLDKEKLEKFLSNCCDDGGIKSTDNKKVKYYTIYKKVRGIDGVSEFVCFVESEDIAKAICKNDRYYYEEIEVD